MTRMAEQLPSYAFHERSYPWDTWLDGSIWKLTRGQDFTCGARTLVTNARNRAAHRGLRVHAAVEGTDVVVLRAYAPGI